VGVTWMSFHLPAPSPAAFLDNIASFGRDVIPELRGS